MPRPCQTRISRAEAMPSLTGKVAIVTGGTRGIGLATARALLREGAQVAFTGTSAESVARGAAALQNHAPKEQMLALQLDVRQYAAVEAAWATVASTFGGIDIV